MAQWTGMDSVESVRDGKEGAGGPSGTEDGPMLLPLCDVVGYSCFVVWAFAVGWDRSVSALEGEELGFFLSRCSLFAGVAVASLLLFLAGGRSLVGVASKAGQALFPLLCLALAPTLFLDLPSWAVMTLWFVAGIGQAGTFFLWGLRFQVLSRKQQLSVVCGAFIAAGLILSSLSFVDARIVEFVVVLLPEASYVLLLFAWRQYASEERFSATKASRLETGSFKFRMRRPLEEDGRFVVLKGLFALLYSISLGFVACAALADWLYPANDAVIGLGNVVAALIMVAVSGKHERNVRSILPKLFLPVTSFCYLFLGILWPTAGVLACAGALFVLFGCYEIVNVHTAYAHSPRDTAHCLWDLCASKAGNSIGFFLGWSCATASFFYFQAGTENLLVLCLSMMSVAVVMDTALFKEVKLEFREAGADGVSSEPSEVASDSRPHQGRGRWSIACEELAEQYKLSPRQKEIFLLLAKGRNVQFIKDKLVLSTPTVKSHVYNIYQKMGVHSHQELLDLVEGSVKKDGQGGKPPSQME